MLGDGKEDNEMRRRFCIICYAMVICSLLAGSFALAMETKDIDLTALTQETQRMSRETSSITMVWWIPEVFWEVSFAQSGGLTASQIQEFLKTIREYTMVAVVDGKVGVFGGVTYQPEDFIRANTRLLDAGNKSYPPLIDSDINADTKNLLQMLKPLLVNMIGAMGQNMHFLLFPAKAEDGTEIANAKGKGELKIKLRELEFKWRLPLDALLPTWVCAGCKQECKGSWHFCPWCGAKQAKK